MNVKVECRCGQHYDFDVEPVDGRMPVRVQCPSCNEDGTAAANRSIQQAMPSAPPRVSLGLKADGMSPSVQSPPAPPPLTMPDPSSLRSVPNRPSFAMGVAGAAICGLLAMFAWFLIIKVTHYEIGYAAIGVGALTGYGARKMGRMASDKLAIAASLCALAAILGGEYLAMRSEVQSELDKIVTANYDKAMSYAKEAIALRTDGDIKAFLAKHNDDDEASKSKTVSDKDVSEFKSQQIPNLKKLADGTVTRAKYASSMRQEILDNVSIIDIMKSSFSGFTVLWIILGLSSAWKIASVQNG